MRIAITTILIYLTCCLPCQSADDYGADYCSPPAEERTRVVKCTDDTHAVQWRWTRDQWIVFKPCGLTRIEAMVEKQRSIQYDKIACPATVKQPVEVVEEGSSITEIIYRMERSNK